ncbi:delta-60 repeat domain-containing protein [Hymenobacter saemangeumensis]|uniref:Delta-60 repeat domain-containing protein n=2 Tax=Hymenobacter saemangeumensis TaxID=1084522 RepID=A0ABP8IR01_9BACT
MRLEADGTPDPSFNVGSGFNGAVQHLLLQPDGKILATGLFTQVNGQPMEYVARLNANGSIDTGFHIPNGGLNGAGTRLALQADGRIIIAGDFTTVGGQPVNRIARLSTSGGLDTSFTPPTMPAAVYVAGFGVQPDGNVLVAAGLNSGASGNWLPLMRLLPTGLVDPTFQTGSNFNRWFFSFLSSTEPVILQLDGKILVGTEASTYDGAGIGRVVRLLPSGLLDNSFTSVTSLLNEDLAPSSLQALGNGQILTNTALLNGNGSRDISFAPPIQQLGQVRAVVRQPDGKYIVGGNFNEINGLAAANLARLHSDGSPDATFTATANGLVNTLALQPDGKVVVGGRFDQLSGGPRLAIGRLLPNGALDNSFVPSSQSLPLGTPYVRQVALQPNGHVLVLGQFNLVGPNNVQYLSRLNGATGSEDLSFQPAEPADVESLLVQPDGRIVVAGQTTLMNQSVLVWRMLPDGPRDPGFSLTPVTAPRAGGTLALDAAGNIYVGGYFTSYGTVPTAGVAKLLPSGTVDAGFIARLTGVVNLNCLAVQPNGRVLLGGSFLPSSPSGNAGTLRLLADGTSDMTYTGASGPNANVEQLIVQPDGAIVAAGSFTRVTGDEIAGLTRLVDFNVLTTKARLAHPRVQVWPVPTQGLLHLSIPADTQVQQICLLDLQGKTVLRVPTKASTLTLDVRGLSAGVYVLKIVLASGTELVRIQVQ